MCINLSCWHACIKYYMNGRNCMLVAVSREASCLSWCLKNTHIISRMTGTPPTCSWRNETLISHIRHQKIHWYLQIVCTLCFYTCSRPSACLRLDQALFLSFDFMENKQNAPMIAFRSEIWQKWRTDWEANPLERALDKNIPRASQMPGGAVFQVQSSQQILRKF